MAGARAPPPPAEPVMLLGCGISEGALVPNVEAESQLGSISLHDYVDGSWAVILTLEAFSPVSTTEVGHLAKLKDEFESRGVRVIGVGCDGVARHNEWIVDVQHLLDCEVTFPILADPDAVVHTQFLLRNPRAEENVDSPVGSYLCVVDLEKRVGLAMSYAAGIGRNFYEVLRCIDALQLRAFQAVHTPANWKNGEDVFVAPEVSLQQAREMFPKGFHLIKPYFRLTAQPDL